MTDSSGCQPNLNNLAFYLQGVSVEPSSTITSDYFVTASLPSSAQDRRVWNFITQGTITGTSTLTLNYTQAHLNCPLYNITFEGALNGSLIVHNQVFSAKKYVSYQLVNPYVLVLTINIPPRILECYGPATSQPYYLNMNVNDKATSSTNYFLCTFDDTSGYKNVEFTNLSTTASSTVYFLCVGGGGGGENGTQDSKIYTGVSAGGGGGGVYEGSFSIPPTETVSCTFVVGAGGSSGSPGGPGGTTWIDISGETFTATGGFGGGTIKNGQGGCSGYGNVEDVSGSFEGGSPCSNSQIDKGLGAGGGGGGAFGTGSNGDCKNIDDGITNGGNGGDGYSWEINGFSIGTYGGGGGGYGSTRGFGGSGGGGYGANNSTENGSDGTTGGGGGGAYATYTGGNGGNGLVLFFYNDDSTISINDPTNCVVLSS